jgi:catechol 2,3-dioxygenase-like lactoylglutathione lyase family enzyme
MVKVNGGLHACIGVSDLDGGIEWYGRVLGFKPIQRHIYTEYGVRVVYMRREETELELVETADCKPVRRGNPPQDHVILSGISQLSFRVADLSLAIAHLQEMGIAIIFGPVDASEFNLRACFVRDYENNLVEFIERY